MATISASQVKDLREKTGVGMMECKKALEENGGDMEKAIVWLRERGMSRAAKKEGRITAEGIVAVLVNPEHTAGCLVEVNCETDFVSKNEEFQAFVKGCSELVLKNKLQSVEALEALKLGSETVKEKLTNMIAKIGENMQLRRVTSVSANGGVVAGYSHMGGRIGTLCVLEGATGEDVFELGKDLAMHIAASKPRYLTDKDVDKAELEQEKEISRKKLLEEGKKPEMIENILVGQMKKFYKEVCFVEQAFIKDPAVSIQKHVEATKKGVKIAGFERFALGEGIEKKKENFADEVAAQLRK